METKAEREAERQEILERVLSRSAEAARTIMSFVKPRVGGGTDMDSAWVGGSSLTPRTRPASSNAFRPVNLKYLPRIEAACKQGLPESYKLGTEDEKGYKITFTSWISALKDMFEDCGMDTVFRIMTKQGTVETYILQDWGEADKEMVKEWVNELKEDGVEFMSSTGTVSRSNVCTYDQDNLKWSGKALVNSISLELWNSIEKEVGYGATGPEVFIAILDKMQQVTDAAVRKMVDKLKGMTLKDEPAQNCDTFCNKVYDLAQRIEGSGNPPNDLVSLIAGLFLECEVLAFNIQASNVYTKANRRKGNIGWREVIEEMKLNYRDLVSQGKWSPAKDKVQTENDLALAEIKGLKTMMNKLVQFNN